MPFGIRTAQGHSDLGAVDSRLLREFQKPYMHKNFSGVFHMTQLGNFKSIMEKGLLPGGNQPVSGSERALLPGGVTPIGTMSTPVPSCRAIREIGSLVGRERLLVFVSSLMSCGRCPMGTCRAIV